MNPKACELLIAELKKECPYTLQDLFKIRDALKILENYNLEDKDLLHEVNLFIEQWR